MAVDLHSCQIKAFFAQLFSYFVKQTKIDATIYNCDNQLHKQRGGNVQASSHGGLQRTAALLQGDFTHSNRCSLVAFMEQMYGLNNKSLPKSLPTSDSDSANLGFGRNISRCCQ